MGVPERGGREGRDSWRFRIIKEVGLKAFYREQMAERGRMGVMEEVERRTGTAGAQRGRERETEKKVGKLNEVETSCESSTNSLLLLLLLSHFSRVRLCVTP